MTATLRPRVQVNLVRHDTAGEWILPSTPTGAGTGSGCNVSASQRCVSPVRENWTILSESQVEISYKAALSATPVTAPCSPREFPSSCAKTPTSSRCSPKVPEKVSVPFSQKLSAAVQTNVSSDEDFGYKQRKSRVAGHGANKSRNNRRK